MKKCYFLVALLSGFFLFAGAQQRCASHEVLKKQMAENPSFARKVKETEKSFAGYMRKGGQPDKGKPATTLIIPVVVHVLYNTAEQNINDAQVQSQIDVMNEDFTATNDDYNSYDAGYRGVKGDAEIRFCLVQIVRRATMHRSFAASDGMKYTKRGGSDAVTPMNALNIWVCNLGQNLLGYAQFPGGTPETFGVVCHYRAFGRGAQYNLFQAYNLGRTMTHEVGHCLGLRHIWGDAACGNDFVDDTPLHNTANFGCPAEGHLSTCVGTPLEMWMNYMDYTDDRCMYFLSDDQVSRMNYFIDNDPQLQSIFSSSCTVATTKDNDITTATTTTSLRVVDGNFLVYPNLSSGIVNLKIRLEAAGSNDLIVYNTAGAIVFRQQLSLVPGQNTREIDLGYLTNGVYMVQLKNNSGVGITQKLVISH